MVSSKWSYVRAKPFPQGLMPEVGYELMSKLKAATPKMPYKLEPGRAGYFATASACASGFSASARPADRMRAALPLSARR